MSRSLQKEANPRANLQGLNSTVLHTENILYWVTSEVHLLSSYVQASDTASKGHKSKIVSLI